MKRIVPLVIRDERMEWVYYEARGRAEDGRWAPSERSAVPVPSDDQLTQDLKLACRALDMYADFAWSGGQAIEGDKAAVRIRTAFGLDQEGA